MGNKYETFQVGDWVEATWAGGGTSTHQITAIEPNHVHGTIYKFLDEEGFELGLYGEFLYKLRNQSKSKEA